jgi:hypothetical protein
MKEVEADDELNSKEVNNKKKKRRPKEKKNQTDRNNIYKLDKIIVFLNTDIRIVIQQR